MPVVLRSPSVRSAAGTRVVPRGKQKKWFASFTPHCVDDAPCAFLASRIAEAAIRLHAASKQAPDLTAAHKARERIHACVDELRTVAPDGGAYVSESNYFEEKFQRAYWGSNYPRLAAAKKKYDPSGLFFVHNGVGSDEWSADGFTKL